ncbi:adenosine deaminase [Glaciihabitans tibetensis]|uniref:Adenine deaminase n=1 Tax=Glaciihabitans tibetensis TaxID=1266600 RepID=A0A2T0VED9_9MICO|nr:adenosine deaminase [Glaciihabitans tibetensis]PRY68555.1 adenosine deaminase [Glaciihabitans tibetensis]
MTHISTRSLPKAELHLHIEGTLEPEMVFALAEKNGIALPWSSVEELRGLYSFTDLQSFLDLYYAGMAVLQTEDDFAELAGAYLRRAAEQGVRHAELFFDPQAHTTRGIAIDTVIDGLLRALATARSENGITGGLILCFLRDQPVADAMATLESVAARSADLLGVGLDSAEVGYPPSLFEAVFSRARELGLHVVAHAGEEGPPEYVWEALDLLKVERIDHGVRSLEDPLLVERLRRDRIPLTVCPLSNVRLGGVASLDDHALPAMLEAGLVVTVNSDDPAYFGGYIDDNYSAVARALDLDAEQLRAVAAFSVEASFLGADAKATLLAEIAAWTA